MGPSEQNHPMAAGFNNVSVSIQYFMLFMTILFGRHCTHPYSHTLRVLLTYSISTEYVNTALKVV